MPIRFRRASGDTYAKLWRDALVVCPQCRRCATVVFGSATGGARAVCSHCGYSNARPILRKGVYRRWGTWFVVHPEPRDADDDPVDGAFDLPLWLQVSCCGRTLWAYNSAHLDLIEEYIRADLREPEIKDITYKLPGWMVQAKHRDEVLRAVARLRQRLQECG
jgi:hypothetical protein